MTLDETISWIQARFVLIPMIYVLVEALIYMHKEKKQHGKHDDIHQR